MATAAQTKINHSDLPTVIGKSTVIVDGTTGVQKTVIPIATLGNYTLVQHNRTQFYVPNSVVSNPNYMYTINS